MVSVEKKEDMIMREIVLDTETTGLSPRYGDKLVSIGAVELIDDKPDGNIFYVEINPLRPVPAEAAAIHGLTTEKLKDAPAFAEIAPDFLDFVADSPLIIHNARFDTAFLNAELAAAGFAPISEDRIVDTLPMARRLFPNERVSLDALCEKFNISLAERTLHGALLDARLLASVYIRLKALI